MDCINLYGLPNKSRISQQWGHWLTRKASHQLSIEQCIYPFQLAAVIYDLLKLALDYTVGLVYQGKFRYPV